jgi:hypothetical protein
MKHFFVLLLIFVSASYGVAQNNTSNGISILPLANEKTFVYGEPFYLYFKITNAKDGVNYVYKPEDDININIVLTDLTTGKPVNDIGGFLPNDHTISRVQQMKLEKPTESDAYLSGEFGFIAYHINKYFGIENLSTKKFRHNKMIYFLRTLPVGKYEFTVKYPLYPSSQTIQSSHKFEVVDVPANEQTAFQRYIAATEYACRSHYKGDRNYKKSNENSYEQFINDFPKSIYATHAFVNMVTESYGYANAGPTESERMTKFNEYLSYSGKLRTFNEKMNYVSYLPDIASLASNGDARKTFESLDLVLQKLKNENPEISQKLIRTASQRKGISGLKSYAKQTELR